MESTVFGESAQNKTLLSRFIVTNNTVMDETIVVKKRKGGKQPGSGRPQKFKKELCVGVSVSVPISKAVYVKELIRKMCDEWVKEGEREYWKQQEEQQ